MSSQAPAFGSGSRLRGGLRGAAAAFFMEHAELLSSVLRRVMPIIATSKVVVVTRHDDVRELFLENHHFPVAYADKLNVIMANQPFFLDQDADAAHDHDVNALRLAVRHADIPMLAKATTKRAEDLLTAAGDGPVEVVGFARQVTFEVFSEYLGLTAPAGRDLQEIGQRLFEFQFADPFEDRDFHAEIVQLSAVMRDHLDALIAARKAAPVVDDALGRCLVLQKDHAGFSDVQIRTALLGLLVAIPQLQLVAALALDQLLERRAETESAQELARSGDDDGLSGYVFEALRFDPLAPIIQRRARSDRVIAAGTPRQVTIRKDAKVMLVVQSAMRDPRRIAEPDAFDPTRAARTYLHFGLGLHTCFALAFNQALVPLMLKPLLKRHGLRRAPGARGRLRRRNLIPDQLWVAFDRAAAPPRAQASSGSGGLVAGSVQGAMP